MSNETQGTGTNIQAPKAKAPTVHTMVAMEDGLEVQFPGKRTVVKTAERTDSGLQIRFNFRNGQFRVFTLPEALTDRFALHGAEQRFADATTGLGVDDAVMAADELVEQFYNGNWTAKREASAFAGASALFRALVEFSGNSPEQVKAFLAEKTMAQKMALRSNPKIKEIIERIEAERASVGKVSAEEQEALLGELQGMGGAEGEVTAQDSPAA